ncbi:hypothetical protein DFH11DRAFT_106941 [Phellopilus nigrolimitatus]|nr:hypothetical protein DFH11DRAFT_106941 [Phellopilus nigrolimitatus]
MDRSSEFNLVVSAASYFFFSEVGRFGHCGLRAHRGKTCCAHARQKSTDFVKTRFNVGELRVSIFMFDVGGQRSKRKKRVHVARAENCRLCLFCRAGRHASRSNDIQHEFALNQLINM